MIIQVYNILPSWIFTNENKPSKQLFNMILSQSETSTCQAQFVQHPNSFNIKIRLSDEDWTQYNWNLICLDEKVYYKVTNVEILQQQKHIILNVDAEIDLYLSYIINLFDETSNNVTPVFFKQKHLNRWYYTQNNTTCINFQQQFYLKNKHEQLHDIGINLAKYTDAYNSYLYNDPNTNVLNWSLPIINNDYGQAYCYAVCKLSPSAPEISNPNNGLTPPYFSYQQIPNACLINISNEWNMYNSSDKTLNSTNSSTPKLSVPWWYWLTNIASDQYDDFMLLPIQIENAYVNSNDGLKPITQVTTQNIWNGQGYFTQASYITNLNTQNTLWYPFMCWTVNPQYLYYFVNEQYNTIATGFSNVGTNFQNVFNLEPYLIQYCKYRVRLSGEDCFVDLTFFNNLTPQTLINTLESFTVNMNHPVTQITNIEWDTLQQFNQNILQPYGYNCVNDVIFSINLKTIYPSWSNNWTNYLMNNLNQYHTALNIAHFGLQQAQANIAFNALGSLKDIFNGYFNFLNASESLTGSIFGEKIQQQEYNYLKTGKQEDMSRVANQRLATNNNSITYNDWLLAFIFESPVQYEQNLVANYCMLNGYIVDRWIPWLYWKNRTYCNYVKCCYFSDCLLSSLIFSYKKVIDQIMNTGIRVWMQSSMNLFDANTLNLSSFIIANGYINSEINQNNDEINYLNND